MGLPAVIYRCIVADPPWPLRWSGGAASRRNGRGEIHVNHQRSARSLPYPVLPLKDIEALPVRELVDVDAHLYLWIPDRFLIEGVGARVVRAWGFRAPRLLVWRKSGYGLGTFPRPQHEAAIVAVRGSLPFRERGVGSVQDWKLSYAFGFRQHSRKPEGFLDLVERASPGPYLELFARRQRLGWDTWGDEALQHVALETS
jgi:N6-adenosine-specific RNA methylase IME4